MAKRIRQMNGPKTGMPSHSRPIDERHSAKIVNLLTLIQQTQPEARDGVPPAVLVTGGGRRIGAAIAEDLAAHGYAVAIHCNRSKMAADALAGRLRDMGAVTAVAQADLTDRGCRSEPCRDSKRGTRASDPASGNNVAGVRRRWADGFRLERLGQALRRSTRSAGDADAAICRGAAGVWTSWSSTCSINVWKPTPRYLSYTMSKAALLAATKTMAQALAPHIRVNAIGPGPTLRNEGQTDAQFAEVVDAVLLGAGLRFRIRSHHSLSVAHGRSPGR